MFAIPRANNTSNLHRRIDISIDIDTDISIASEDRPQRNSVIFDCCRS